MMGELVDVEDGKVLDGEPREPRIDWSPDEERAAKRR